MLKFLISLCFCLFCVTLCEDEHEHDGHGHGHEIFHSEDKYFDEIYEHLGVTSKDTEGHHILTKSKLEKLFTDLNFRTCAANEESNQCNLIKLSI